MPLIDKKWKKITVHEVVASFLLGEKHKFLGFKEIHLIDAPNLSNHNHNAIRLALLYNIRGALLTQVPTDTQWYRVQTLTDNELNELYATGRCGWDYGQDQRDLTHQADNNELRATAMRRSAPLTSNPIEWVCPILWGHEKNGPFTIIEGNHRFCAYASTSPSPGMEIEVIIGLSVAPCFWHKLDKF